MFKDEFKSRYTTIPFAFHKEYSHDVEFNLISHRHRELELIAMIDGTADFYIDSIQYKLKKGDVLIIPPYCIHRSRLYPQSYYDCICFDTSLLWDKSLINGLENGTMVVKECLSARQSYSSKVYDCIRNAIKSCEQNEPGWEMDTIGNLSIIFGQLKKHSFFTRQRTANSEHQFEKLVFEYITQHFSEPITSRTASKELYLNNSYFCRLFKKYFGTCFAEYLMEYRVEKAKVLLKNNKQSISDIAIKTGFNSFSYFSKVFKNIVGITPSEYRKKY